MVFGGLEHLEYRKCYDSQVNSVSMHCDIVLVQTAIIIIEL